jgi:predicted MFS family arabinose efflux permease
MGIPLGIGVSFLLAGTLGATQGWRGTFHLLGAAGVAIALALLLLEDRRDVHEGAVRGAPFRRQVLEVLAALRDRPAVVWTIAGFVLVHMAFTGLAFMQLWLVRERGFDAAGIARQIGTLQLVLGMLGCVAGGMLGDRLSRRSKGGHAGFLAALVALCGPLMIAARFAPAGSPLFYLGLSAGFFLPMAAYGPAITLIQGLTPMKMRSTVVGVTMMLINVFAIALGNLAVGALSDHLATAGSSHALTTILLGTDILVLTAAIPFAMAARGPRVQATGGAAVLH